MQSANRELKAFADRMLHFKRDERLSFVHLNPVGVDARLFAQRLRDIGFDDLLLSDDASLSMPHGGEYHPDLGLRADDGRLDHVTLTALGWGWDAYAAQYPGSPAWGRQLEISLWYRRERRSDPLVKQVISVQAYDRPGLPDLARDVWAEAYAETGYEGHNHRHRRARRASEVRDFIAIAAELFAHAPEGRP